MHLKLMMTKCERLYHFLTSIGDLKMLHSLSLSHNDNLKRLPKGLGSLILLWDLRIGCCLIKKLPKSMSQLSRLQNLALMGCKNLQKLPTSIKNLQKLQQFCIEDCGSIEAMGALITLQGLPMWGNTLSTKLLASLGFVSTLVVFEDNLEFHKFSYLQFVGTSQVLEEDESGFLKAYCNKSSEVITLV